MGRDKVLETIGNTSLLERVVFRLSSLDSDIIIVTANQRSLPQFTGHPKLKIIADIYPGKGSLGGIYSGLVASASPYNLVVASDMPFLNRALLHYMIQLSGNFDVVAPRLGDLVEPLHAVYAKSCLAPLENMLKQGNLSVHQLFTRVRIRYVEAEEINQFDPKHLSFFNVNTEADLRMARELAGEGEITGANC